jgi:hypothetical protein
MGNGEWGMGHGAWGIEEGKRGKVKRVKGEEVVLNIFADFK